MNKISILGCGWLGLPLASLLIKNGFIVKGSTKDKNKIPLLKDNSIEPYLVDINPLVVCDNINKFLKVDTLLINIPPERRNDIVDYHREQLTNLIKLIENSSIKNVIFASSTSVYRNTNDVVYETDKPLPDKLSGKALVVAEELIFNNKNFRSTIVRFAGLIGYDRNPINSINKKKLILNPNTPLNLIHRDDCINILLSIIRKNIWNEILNACCDTHPTRKEYYSALAKKNNLQLPTFDNSTKLQYKVVSNKKLKDLLDYNLIYPDPFEI